MNYFLDSLYKNYASKTLEFLPADTKELFEYNKKNNYIELQKYNLLDKKIEYKFNSHGFRSEEFSDEPTILFLGCSFTVGIGLRQEEIYTHYVANEFNLKCANLGIGGGSMDTCFRIAYHYLPIIKPKICFLLSPPESRLEIITNNRIQIYNIDILINKKTKSTYLEDYFGNKSNLFYNYQKNHLAIESLCKSLQIPFISMSWDTLISLRSDSARDLIHCGKNTHKNFSKLVIKKIKSEIKNQ